MSEKHRLSLQIVDDDLPAGILGPTALRLTGSMTLSELLSRRDSDGIYRLEADAEPDWTAPLQALSAARPRLTLVVRHAAPGGEVTGALAKGGIISDDTRHPDDISTDPDSNLSVNYYTCPGCGFRWVGVWDSGCDDECPRCDTRDISPVVFLDS